MTRHNQLADGSTKPIDSVIDLAAQHIVSAPIDMSSIFPGPGVYMVTPTETFVYNDEDHTPKTVRFKLNIDKVGNDPNSSLVGRAFSIFFGLQTTASDDNPAPISFTARRLYYLFNGEYPTENLSSIAPVLGWLKDLEGGMSFVIERSVKRDKQNVLRANDKLLSYETFQSLHGDDTPEESPEVAAEAGNL